MTPEQRREIVRLAAAWSMASFNRGIDAGLSIEATQSDHDAADAFYAYMDGLK